MNRSTVIGFVSGMALSAVIALGIGAAAGPHEVGRWQPLTMAGIYLTLVDTATGDIYFMGTDKKWERQPSPLEQLKEAR